MRENGPRGKVEVEGKTPDHDERLTKEALALNAERDRAGAEFQAERDRADAEFRRLGLKFRFFYSILGLILGLACILAGSILGLFGVVGHTSFTASLLGLTTNLNDAAPGVVVFVVGIFMVFITRFSVKEFERTTTDSQGLRTRERGVSMKTHNPRP